jgi:acetyl esterase/lipase
MNYPVPGTSDLPPYARLIRHDGAPLRRAWLNMVFRLAVKRSFRMDADIGKLRALQAKLDTRFAKPDPEMRRTLVDCGGVAAEWIDVPETRPGRVVLYLHGGAWMFRFPTTHAALAARWCRRLGARALMVDYRLAPEHPYPAAPDDCVAAYRWLLAQGVAAGDVVIGGDSAGGNLTLATLHRIKAAGLPLPACAVALSPFVDFSLSSRSLIVNQKRDPMFTLEACQALRPYYIQPEQMLEADASPLFGDFSGLPPLFLQASNTEMLRDESLRVAERAHAQGVTVEVELWQHMPHVFQAMAKLPQSAAALDSVVRFIRAHTGWGPGSEELAPPDVR